MTSGTFFLSGHIKGSRAYVTHDGFLATTGSAGNTALISFNKKNTKARLYWDKDSDNSLSKSDALIGKFKVTKMLPRRSGVTIMEVMHGLVCSLLATRGRFHLTSVNMD